MAAPALAASIADCAICCGVTGTAGLRPGVSAEPVTAHEIITLRCMGTPADRLAGQYSRDRARLLYVKTFGVHVPAGCAPCGCCRPALSQNAVCFQHFSS